ncbi:hypothetical protein GCM10023220_04030 [Streptomyces ziwulingensis]|uniref:DUF3592 domain-containing protein n=2 Tax=Streptomyces ziwulingensis TaxID=1045501 RepID=A0ABP9APA3_9ACTN
MRRNAVWVVATCVDHIYEGYTAHPKRMVCTYVTPDGRELRWVLAVGPDFPLVGEAVPLVYDGRNEGLAKRQDGKGKRRISLGLGWTLLAVILLVLGATAEYVL